MVHEINGNSFVDYSLNKSKNTTAKNADAYKSLVINFKSTDSGMKEKTTSEIMGFEKSSPQVPPRKVDINDGRPDSDNKIWNWINNNFDGVYITSGGAGKGITNFTYMDEGNTIPTKVRVVKFSGQPVQLKIISAEPDKSVVDMQVDPESGKIVEKRTLTQDSHIREVYNQDGSVESERLNPIGPTGHTIDRYFDDEL